MGLSDELDQQRVKVFCPLCSDIFLPRSKNYDLDGAFFGTSFPSVLLKAYPDLNPRRGPRSFQPLIFGFKIFGQRGSAFEEHHDHSGQLINKSAA